MRLADLSPQWIVREGQRIGFVFVSPANPAWHQSCFFEKVQTKEQWRLFDSVLGEHGCEKVQGCRVDFAWTHISGDTFESLTVKPSIDGSRGGLWHGYITNGEIINA